MNLTVFYTPRSRETLVTTYEFVLHKFGKKSADKFVDQAEKLYP